MVTNAKGSRAERTLVRLLAGLEDESPFDEGEFAIMRAPASGSGTERDQPDVFAGNGAAFWAIEAKVSGGDPIYVQQHEVDALFRFASFWGAYACIGVRFDAKNGDPWYGNEDDTGWRFFDVSDLHHTDAGSVRVKKEDISDGMRLEELREAPLAITGTN